MRTKRRVSAPQSTERGWQSVSTRCHPTSYFVRTESGTESIGGDFETNGGQPHHVNSPADVEMMLEVRQCARNGESQPRNRRNAAGNPSVHGATQHHTLCVRKAVQSPSGETS